MDKFETKAMIEYYIDVIEKSSNPRHVMYAQNMLNFHLSKIELDTDMIKGIKKELVNLA